MTSSRVLQTLWPLVFAAFVVESRPAPCAEPSAPRTEPIAPPVAGTPAHTGMGETLRESLLGNAYAEPSTWRPLPLGTLFTEGWDEAWVGPPPGEGGAPRQGWLNAFDGVFYRLGIATFGYAHDFADNGDQYTGALTLYTPFNRRFELRWDVPFVVSNKGSRNTYDTSFGDFTVTPRLMLSETRNVTQTFNVAFRMPTGDIDTGNGAAAVTPDYEFWTNPWQTLVVRGGAGMFAPYGHDSIREARARTAFIGNLAAGYYCTPHEAAPIGDLVFYVASGLAQATDDRGPSTTTLTFTPGFRTHVGANWYLLGGVEVPATHPQPFDYQLLGGLMKVW